MFEGTFFFLKGWFLDDSSVQFHLFLCQIYLVLERTQLFFQCVGLFFEGGEIGGRTWFNIIGECGSVIGKIERGHGTVAHSGSHIFV